MAKQQNKFLLQHFKELHEHPLYHINASPLEGNITEWCGNVFFPESSEYPGLILHFKLNFEASYPSSSPKLELRTNIDHTHVFFPRCCFSLLPDFRGYFEGIGLSKTAYWNPTRTIRSFLEAFFQFLVVDCDRQSHGRGPITNQQRTQAMNEATKFSCDKCGHTFQKPFPVCPTISQQEADQYNDEKMGKGESLSEQKQAEADLNCSITGKTIHETVIGFGVDVSQARNGKQITTDLYPMCYESFYKDNVRISAGGSKITHWIPFAVNEENWKKALPVARESISLIMTGKPNAFKPELVLDVIGELWKTKAVEMMKGEEHASEKVLIGFCAFHHLLLAFASSYPELVKIATDEVKKFIRSPNDRNKSACPDFGRFLPLFLISDILWDDDKKAGNVCVSELFTRNAMWILKQHPNLENSSTDSGRVSKSWEPSQVGLKLTCFQIRYILEVGRPVNEPEISKNFQRLNELLGRPTSQMIQAFQQTVKKVQAINNYKSWFESMGLGNPSDTEILHMLQEAMKNSAIQGYHGNNSNSGKGRGRKY